VNRKVGNTVREVWRGVGCEWWATVRNGM